MLKKTSQLPLCNKQKVICDNCWLVFIAISTAFSLFTEGNRDSEFLIFCTFRRQTHSSSLFGFRIKYLVQTECFDSTFY